MRIVPSQGFFELSRLMSESARYALMGMLDPEIRRRALRDPQADYAFYHLISQGSAEAARRKMQASDAFPLFTRLLRSPSHAKEICAGGSVSKAISVATGLPESHVRALRGVHWQRFGHAMRGVLAIFDHQDEARPGIREAMRALPADMLPHAQSDWQFMDDVASSGVAELVPSDRRGDFWRAVRRDPAGWSKLVRGDLKRALSDTAAGLAALATRRLPNTDGWGVYGLCNRVLENMVFAHVAGKAVSIKTLRAFAEVWHRDVGQRNTDVREIKRSLMGDIPMVTWAPLTNGVFSHERGRLEWITDEDSIVAEGMRMSHCVGSYLGECAGGASHIAQVFGTDGTRSTVEFGVDLNGCPYVRQNMSFKDAEASGDCVEVVLAFLRQRIQAEVQADRAPGRLSRLDRREVEAPRACRPTDRRHQGRLCRRCRSVFRGGPGRGDRQIPGRGWKAPGRGGGGSRRSCGDPDRG